MDDGEKVEIFHTDSETEKAIRLLLRQHERLLIATTHSGYKVQIVSRNNGKSDSDYVCCYWDKGRCSLGNIKCPDNNSCNNFDSFP